MFGVFRGVGARGCEIEDLEMPCWHLRRCRHGGSRTTETRELSSLASIAIEGSNCVLGILSRVRDLGDIDHISRPVNWLIQVIHAIFVHHTRKEWL